ncbi:MAG: hypothetical protein O2927_00905 [Planctomycetota bacterium]|nr:hypothetical protein [Planctomycetota bacterium]
MPTLPSWMVPIGLAVAMIATVAGFAIVAFGLWGDRGPRRRRCPRCWHDLSKTPGMVCGECGFTARAEAELVRRRRRWSHAMLGLVMLLAGVGSIETLGGTREPWSYVPGRMLIAMLPWSSGPTGPSSLHGELVRRLGRGELTDGSIGALVAAIVEGDEAARPPSVEWRSKYASLLVGTLVRAIEARPELAAKLATLPPIIEFSLASPWPEDLPAYGTLDLQHWWVSPVQLRIAIDAPEHETLGRISIGYDSRGRGWRRGWPRFPIEFDRPWPVADDTPVELRVRVDRRLPEFDADATTEDRSRIEPAGDDEGDSTSVPEIAWGPWVADPNLAFDTVATVAAAPPVTEHLQPVDDPVMRAAIAAAFDPGLVVREGGPRPYAIRFDVSRTSIPELADTALGLEVEVRERGEIRRRTWIWWLAGPEGGPAEWRISEEDAAGLTAATDHEPEEGIWTLVVRGDRTLAARAIDAAVVAMGRGGETVRYWDGRFEMPLRVRRIPGAFPPRPWFETAADDAPIPQSSSEESDR